MAAVTESHSGRKRNVVLLLGSFNSGGAERQLIQLARLLKGSPRYAVRLAVLDKSGVLRGEAERLETGEIPAYPLGSFASGRMVAQTLRFRRFLKRERIDVLHTEGFYTNVFGLIGATLAGVPARVAFRGEIEGLRTPAQQRVERLVFRLAHTIHANSLAVRSRLLEEGVPDRKIAVVYNGLDLKRVQPDAAMSRSQMLAACGLEPLERRQLVTLVANLRYPVKDHPMFVRMAARVRKARPNTAFIVAGEGVLLESTRQLAREAGLGDSVLFIGSCERLSALLAVSDVCVLTSKSEGFSNAILEYMAAGRPVVATAVGGAGEAIQDGVTGYLVAAGDDNAMAGHVVKLLSDEHVRQAFGEAGRRRIQDRFSDRAQLLNTERMYDVTLARLPWTAAERSV